MRKEERKEEEQTRRGNEGKKEEKAEGSVSRLYNAQERVVEGWGRERRETGKNDTVWRGS